MKRLTYTILLSLSVALFSTCEKFEVKPATKVETGTATPLATTITVNAKIIDLSGEGNTDHGFCYATHDDPTFDDSKVSKGSPTIGEFNGNIEGLTMNTQYYLRAYCQSAEGIVYGKSVAISTLDWQSTLSTNLAINITSSSATSGGSITSDGGAFITTRGVVWSTSQNPTAESNQGITENGSGTGSWVSEIVGLTPNTVYYVRAYATNSYGTAYGNQVNFTSSIPDGPGSTVTDIDGNTYNTIWINGRQWLKENLKTTKYNDGTTIPLVTDNTTWAGLSTHAYCWYNNDIANKPIYGALYNGYVIVTGKVCPSGWHVPTDAEWFSLENYVDPSINDPNITGWRGVDGGNKLKSTNGWGGDENGTDVFGFSALPSGFRGSFSGSFSGPSNSCYWWSSTMTSASGAWFRSLGSDRANINRNKFFDSYSVRCIKDN